MPKESVLSKKPILPIVSEPSGVPKLRAKEIVKSLEIPASIWAGTRVHFGLTDDKFLSEAQFKAYINAFLNTPASK